jgi:RimJ/RimL family protein N-acetyltransferase
MKTIETERLVLREWRLEDADDIYEYAKKNNFLDIVSHSAFNVPVSNPGKSLVPRSK